jgi:hypothetical protein
MAHPAGTAGDRDKTYQAAAVRHFISRPNATVSSVRWGTMTTIPEAVDLRPGLLGSALRWLREALAALGRWLRKVLAFLRQDRARVWLQRKAVGAWMNILIAVAAGVTTTTAGLLAEKHWPPTQTWDVGSLKLFALWCLSFLPGWLYVRFIGMRAKALWNEYVLNLHRLGWDLPENLPEPPRTSEFHDRWKKKNDPQLPSENIYQQKFEAYYGRDVTRAATNDQRGAAPDEKRASYSGQNEDYRVSGESLFPVFLATAVFAVGWSAVLWDTRFVSTPDGAWDVLKYGFIGAYAFVTGMLVRRFYQSDLRPSAYASAVLRIVLVLLIVVVVHQVIGGTGAMANHAELAVAFVIGFFPLVGLQLLQRVTSKVLGVIVPPITSEYPLDQLDGLNLWYEARLTEEGVEDMQNLTTMNLVDIILHTRVPPGRLVDWTDQAFLLIHLDKTDRGELNDLRQKLRQQWQERQDAPAAAPEPCAEFGAEARLNLRRVGIRTATDLLKAFSKEAEQPRGSMPERIFAPQPEIKRLPLPESQLRLLISVLGSEPGLVPIWNWQQNGPQFTCAARPQRTPAGCQSAAPAPRPPSRP